MSKSIPPPLYLGDSVYVQPDSAFPGRIVLTTDSHLMDDAGNILVLEPEVAVAFLKYVEHHYPHYLKQGSPRFSGDPSHEQISQQP